jgi:cell division protein FtsL
VSWLLRQREYAGMNWRKLSLSEKIFYVVSLLIVFSMVFSMIYVLFVPPV